MEASLVVGVDKKYHADVSISTIIVFLVWVSCYTTRNMNWSMVGMWVWVAWRTDVFLQVVIA